MPTFDRWLTGVTFIAPGEIAPRGRGIAELIDRASWTEVMWLVLLGAMPTADQEDALRRALVAAVDHGVAAPSTASARVLASTRVAPPIAMAAGLMAFAGPAHGGAAAEAGRILVALVEDAKSRDEGSIDDAAVEFVRERRSRGERVPGYGHPYHPIDPRVEPLMSSPASNHAHRDAARALELAVQEVISPQLRMNADAAVAALLLDVGLEPDEVSLVTAIGRAVGIAAHVREELVNEQPFRAPGLDTVEFVVGDAR